MSSTWRTARVFISSTFRDMQAERDHLVRVVFPALRERLEPFRVHLIDIDLRWGVTREQAESDQALELCLEQIDECRPFFLGLLGQRYGWIPQRIAPETLTRLLWLRDASGRSVTELEFLHGALNDPTQARRTAFCIRAAETVLAVPAEFRSVYVEPDEASADRLRDLAERVRRSGLPLLDGYPAVWNVAASRFDGLDVFGQFVQERLWEGIRAELALPAAPSRTDPFARESEDHERFLESRLRVYVGREDVGRAVQAFADGGSPHACLITGPSGSGKSAALARFVADFRRRHPFATTLVHFVGAGPHSTSLRELLGRLCRLLRARLGFADEIPDEVAPLAALLRKFLNRVPVRNRVLLAIDALDQLDPTDRARELDWLPVQTSSHVRVVVSCATDDRSLLRAFARRPHHRVEVHPLGDAEQHEIIRAVPSLSAKALDDEQVRLLLDNPVTVSPLYLLVALEELRGFGSFEQLTERVRGLPRGDDAVAALFDQVLARLEHDFDAALVRTVLPLLAAARRGLSERELRDLVAGEPDADDLFSVLRQLRQYLLDRGGLLDFYHRDLLRAVRGRYLTADEPRRAAHDRLARFFLSQPSWIFEDGERQPNERRADELPGHLRQARRWEDFAGLLCDLGFLEAKAEAGLVFDLARDFPAALEGLPADHPRRPVLRLLEEALRGDIHFLARHPSTLFQCLWNRGRWYNGPGSRELTELLEAWRTQRDRERPGALWLRSLRPPEVPLGTAQRAVFRGHEGDVHGVAFSGDGARLASTSADGTVRVWDVASGEELACLRGHREASWGVAFFPDGERLVSASWDRTVRLWHVHGGELALLRGHRERAWGVAVSPDGRLVAAAGDDGTARVWDAATGERVGRVSPETGPLWCVAFSPDGRLVATGGDDGMLRLWDTATWTEQVVAVGHLDEVMCVAFSRDGSRVVTASGDTTVRVWDTAGRELVCHRGHTGWVPCAAFSPDGDRLVSGSWDGTVRLWDPGGERACLRGHLGPVWGVAFAPDGRTVASAGGDATVRLWDAGGIAGAEQVGGHRGMLTTMAFSADGRRLVTGARDKTVRIWDTLTGAELLCLRGHEASVHGVDFSPDGARVASGSDDGTVRFWDPVTGTEVGCVRGHGKPVWKVAFSPDGRRLATGSDDQTVRLWDAATGQQVGCLRGHTRWICALAFAADGRLLASASGDNTVRIWDLEAGTELTWRQTPWMTVTRLGFTPDGRRLYCGSTDRRLHIWDLETQEWSEVGEGLYDVAALASGEARRGLRTVARERETVVLDDAGAEIAWLSASLKWLATHPGGDAWAGTFRSHLYLFRLEGGAIG